MEIVTDKSYFCSQQCFAGTWKSHKDMHKKPVSTTDMKEALDDVEYEEDLTYLRGEDPMFETTLQLQMEGRFAEAHEILMRALRRKEKELSEDDPKLAVYYAHAGTSFTNGNFKEVLRLYRRAYDIIVKTRPHGADNFAAVTILLDIANVERTLQHYPDAITAYNTALGTMVRRLNPRNLMFIDVYNKIGTLFKEMGDYEQSVVYFKLCLDALLQSRAHRRQAITVYYNLGMVLIHLGRNEEALDNLDTCVKIAQSSYNMDEDHSCTKMTMFLCGLGQAHAACGDHASAVASFTSCIDIIAKMGFPLGSASVACMAYSELGTSNLALKDVDAALLAHTTGLKHARTTYRDMVNRDAAEMNFALGIHLVHVERDNADDALAALREAIAVVRNMHETLVRDTLKVMVDNERLLAVVCAQRKRGNHVAIPTLQLVRNRRTVVPFVSA